MSFDHGVYTDEFERLEVVSVEYDEQQSYRYDPGTYIGIIVKRQPDRVKVLFIYETGDPEFAWLQFDWGNRWIDKTFAAIVTVEEATSSQREELKRRVSPEKLLRLVTKESEQKG